MFGVSGETYEPPAVQDERGCDGESELTGLTAQNPSSCLFCGGAFSNFWRSCFFVLSDFRFCCQARKQDNCCLGWFVYFYCSAVNKAASLEQQHVDSLSSASLYSKRLALCTLCYKSRKLNGTQGSVPDSTTLCTSKESSPNWWIRPFLM